MYIYLIYYLVLDHIVLINLILKKNHRNEYTIYIYIIIIVVYSTIHLRHSLNP